MKYDLHDSLIERADYFPSTGRAELKIRLCNWRQGIDRYATGKRASRRKKNLIEFR